MSRSSLDQQIERQRQKVATLRQQVDEAERREQAAYDDRESRLSARQTEQRTRQDQRFQAQRERLEQRRPCTPRARRPRRSTADAAPADEPAPTAPAPTPSWRGREDFEQRRADRVERLSDAAQRLAGEADVLARRSHAMLPDNGQPILVGHHSERAMRRLHERSDALMHKSVGLFKAASETADAAAAAAENTAISSDDPTAPDKLRERIAELEGRQAQYRAINRAVRSKQPRESLAALGFSDKRIDNILTPDELGRRGIPDYALANNSANVRRLKARLAELERAATTAAPPPHEAGDVTITWDTDTNRVQVETRARSPEERRRNTELFRGRGFVFSRTIEAWVRKANPAAWRAALDVAQLLSGETPRPVS